MRSPIRSIAPDGMIGRGENAGPGRARTHLFLLPMQPGPATDASCLSEGLVLAPPAGCQSSIVRYHIRRVTYACRPSGAQFLLSTVSCCGMQYMCVCRQYIRPGSCMQSQSFRFICAVVRFRVACLSFWAVS